MTVNPEVCFRRPSEKVAAARALACPEYLELTRLVLAHLTPDAQREINNLQVTRLKFMERGSMPTTRPNKDL
jgi:hypothetical protein